MNNSERIKFNISGQIFETFKKTLERYTLLGNIDNIQTYYSFENDEYFFNRNRLCFGAILYFYQSHGLLIRPSEIDITDFETECMFYQIPEDIVNTIKSKDNLFSYQKQEKPVKKAVTMKMKLWNFLEEPKTSRLATVFALFSLAIVSFSVLITCMETELNDSHDTTINSPWVITELTINTWFLFELIIRFLFFPESKLKFLQNSMNIVDLIAVLSYFALFIINNEEIKSTNILRVLRLFRLFRLNRLTKHSKRIQIVGHIIKDSLHDFQVLIACLLMVVTFGASVMFYIEGHEIFTSIPESMWWAVQTITTLGYGDITPSTVIGKIFSACFMAFGAITISLPVLSIVSKFTSYYSSNVR